MTDRIKGFQVTLGQDMRDDDAKILEDAISLMRGVVQVKPIIRTFEDTMIQERTKLELKGKLLEVLR